MTSGQWRLFRSEAVQSVFRVSLVGANLLREKRAGPAKNHFAAAGFRGLLAGHLSMKRHLLLFAALGVAFFSSAADLASFNGTWVITGGEADGNSISGSELGGAQLTLQDGKYKFEMGDTRAAGTYTVDFTKKPLVMASTETEGRNVGVTMRAIAEFTPGGWRACYNFAGGDAPTEFKAGSGSGFFLAQYERKPGTAAAVRPLKVLLLAGGCCHDYAAQKDILKKGLEARANVQVDVIYSPDGSTKPPLSIYGNPDYAKGYDVVLHDECAADINEQSVIEGVLKPHRDGIPAVNLHCAMHCYRIGDPNAAATPGTPHALWFEYLGLQSSGHGPQKPISLTFLGGGGAVTQGLTNWTTINEELYNNIKIWDGAKPLVRGKQGAGDKPGQNDTVVAWTHEYGPKKTRVFATTLGHNNETVADARYLDLVTRGLLWSCGKLGDDGKPLAGFGPAGK
jgi:uncharacterized protein (TIGR03067 family)